MNECSLLTSPICGTVAGHIFYIFYSFHYFVRYINSIGLGKNLEKVAWVQFLSYCLQVLRVGPELSLWWTCACLLFHEYLHNKTII